MTAPRAVITFLVVMLSAPIVKAGPADDLRREQDKIERAIAEALVQHDKLAGGLLKTLIAARLEVLRTNAALVKQRIHALESGAKISVEIQGITPDPRRVANLETDIRALEGRLKVQAQR